MWILQEKEIIEFGEKLKKDFPNLHGAVPSGICKGWHSIIYDLSSKISELLKDIPNEEWPEIVQIKEKFGTLRFYINYEKLDKLKKYIVLYDRIINLVSEAEEKSSLTCEWCGAPGQLSDGYLWVKTLCDDCNEKRKGGYLKT